MPTGSKISPQDSKEVSTKVGMMPLTGGREMDSMIDSLGGFVRFALVVGLTAISVAAQSGLALPMQAPGVSGLPQASAPTYANIEYAPPLSNFLQKRTVEIRP